MIYAMSGSQNPHRDALLAGVRAHCWLAYSSTFQSQ